MQLLCRWNWGSKLQQLKGNAVLQVDLQRLTADKAAEEAQAGPRPFSGGHDGCGEEGGVDVAGCGDKERSSKGRQGGFKDREAVFWWA